MHACLKNILIHMRKYQNLMMGQLYFQLPFKVVHIKTCTRQPSLVETNGTVPVASTVARKGIQVSVVAMITTLVQVDSVVTGC